MAAAKPMPKEPIALLKWFVRGGLKPEGVSVGTAGLQRISIGGSKTYNTGHHAILVSFNSSKPDDVQARENDYSVFGESLPRAVKTRWKRGDILLGFLSSGTGKNRSLHMHIIVGPVRFEFYRKRFQKLTEEIRKTLGVSKVSKGKAHSINNRLRAALQEKTPVTWTPRSKRSLAPTFDGEDDAEVRARAAELLKRSGELNNL